MGAELPSPSGARMTAPSAPGAQHGTKNFMISSAGVESRFDLTDLIFLSPLPLEREDLKHD